MSKKDYLLKKAAEEETRRRREKKDTAYRPWTMDTERMPLGCWLWVLGAAAAVVYAVMKLMNVVH